jgi:hypothetical protein
VLFACLLEFVLLLADTLLVAGLLVDGLDKLSSVVEALEPLPPGLPFSLVVVLADIGALCPTSYIERYAGTRWYRSLTYARICTLSISLMKSGHRFDHPLCAPPQLAHFR